MDELLPKDADLTKYNAEYEAKHAGEAEHIFAVVRTERFLDPKAPVQEKLVGLVEKMTFEEAREALDVLNEVCEETEEFKKVAKAKWEMAKVFA